MTDEQYDNQLEEAYIAVFGDDWNEHDLNRITFLEEIVEGNVQVDGKCATLEDALNMAMENDKKTPEDNDGHTPYTKELLVKDALREWYLQPNREPLQKAKPGILQFCMDADDLEYVIEDLEGCMRVLLKHYELKEYTRHVQVFDNALKTRDGLRATAVHMAADYVVRSRNEKSITYIKEKLSKYDTELKIHLEEAFKHGDAQEIERATKDLEATGDPELLKYVQEKTHIQHVA